MDNVLHVLLALSCPAAIALLMLFMWRLVRGMDKGGGRDPQGGPEAAAGKRLRLAPAERQCGDARLKIPAASFASAVLVETLG